MRTLSGAYLALAVASTCADAQFAYPTSPSVRDFVIMAWGGTRSDPEQLRLMKEAGPNVTVFCKAKDLDAVHAAGLGCVIRDPRIDRADLGKLPPDAELRAIVADIAEKVGKHPAVLGIYLVDEPGAKQMPGLGKLATMLREAMPAKNGLD